MTLGASAAILAGGQSLRFGSNKALAPWNGAPLVQSVARRLSAVCSETFVVAKHAGDLAFLSDSGIKVVADGRGEHHALGGLAAALEHSGAETVFVCACDMPFVAPALVARLVEAVRGYDAAVPVWQGNLQPLCAVYSRACAGVARIQIAEGNLKLQDLFGVVHTRFLLEPEISAVDPDGLSFRDLDTREDYERAARLPPC